MEAEFWHQRWQRNEIGFHQSDINPLLQQHWPQVKGNETGGTVFVPLCGKSLDMVWLQEQGHAVIGVELSTIAVDDFFKTQGLSAAAGTEQGLEYRESSGFRLYCGDFFAVSAAHLDNVKAVYDRAALIALPPDLQARYAEHLLTLLPERPPMLLVTLEYDQQEMAGPPFATPEARVRALFGAAYTIDLLQTRECTDNDRLKSRGLSYLYEKVYWLHR